jgi:hypothetical protein
MKEKNPGGLMVKFSGFYFLSRNDLQTVILLNNPY